MTELMPSLCNDCVARNQCGNDDVKMCVSYIKEVKIKCDDCKFEPECADYGWLGCKKFTPAPSEPMTNEEWFCQLPTEQKAEWICSVHEKCYYCGAKRVSDREHCPFGDGKCRNNKHEFALWLKQPHTKE